MPRKAEPIYQPVPFTWTGSYVGANAGWAWSHTSSDALLAGVPLSYSGNTNGFVGGGQVGYNYQMGNIVAGLEATPTAATSPLPAPPTASRR
jgi:outer membrane immunogenic protein